MAKKLLLIEDEKAQQLAWKQVFKYIGNFEVEIANNGFEGLTMLGDTIDGIVLDMNMPKLNGIGFLQEFYEKKKYKQYVHLPIFALTVWSDDDAVLKSVERYPKVTLISKEEPRERVVTIIRGKISEK